MRKARFVATIGGALACLLAVAGGAQASIVTLGPPASLIDATESCEREPCTLIQTALPGTGATLTSPVTGAVIRWNLVNGASPYSYRLRVLTHNGGDSYTATGNSAYETPTTALESFRASIPIQAGQVIGVDYEQGAPVGVKVGGNFEYVAAVPPLSGTPFTVTAQSGFAIGFNAEVLPAPSITAISRTAGSVKGGASVTIAGTDLAEVQSVSFGAKPAASFTVDSETQITAVAPARSALGPVGVRVTTLAGTAAAAHRFTYRGCTVPKLKRKKLKAAKRALRKRGCKFGTLRKKKGVKARRGRVIKQWPKPGTVRPPGARVGVKLG